MIQSDSSHLTGSPSSATSPACHVAYATEVRPLEKHANHWRYGIGNEGKGDPARPRGSNETANLARMTPHAAGAQSETANLARPQPMCVAQLAHVNVADGLFGVVLCVQYQHQCLTRVVGVSLNSNVGTDVALATATAHRHLIGLRGREKCACAKGEYIVMNTMHSLWGHAVKCS